MYIPVYTHKCTMYSVHVDTCTSNIPYLVVYLVNLPFRVDETQYHWTGATAFPDISIVQSCPCILLALGSVSFVIVVSLKKAGGVKI